jgi:hypothetical protein
LDLVVVAILVGLNQFLAQRRGGFVGGSNFFGFTDTGTTQFATYAYNGSYLTGLGINTEDLLGTIWTPDNSWLALGTSIAALGFIEGLYTIADDITGEFITIAINSAVSVPGPNSIALFGLGLAGLGFVRRRRQQT